MLKTKINAAGEPYKYGQSIVLRVHFHETFATVASSTMVHLIVSLSVGTSMRTHQLDVVGAYLYAPIAEDLYVWAPKGITKKPGECWKLLSSLYGTQQARADWKAMIS